jgi:hypothetical protein
MPTPPPFHSGISAEPVAAFAARTATVLPIPANTIA